jgi:CRISPR-associated endonuclease/helicase Cas3
MNDDTAPGSHAVRGGVHGFWGKIRFDQAGKVESWLPLASHSLDVAMVFRRLVGLPTFRKRLEAAAGQSLSDPQCDRLAVLALLHDLGKANLGFQDKVFDKGRKQAGHIRELAPLLGEEELCGRLTDALQCELMADWFDPAEGLSGLLLAAWSHHGLPVRFDAAEKTGCYHEAKTRWWTGDGRRDPFRAIADLMSTARNAFPAAFERTVAALPGTARLQHRFAGLVMLADWLGSHTAFFPLQRPAEDPVGFSHSQAEFAVTAVGLDATRWQGRLSARPSGFEQRFGFPPRPLQAAIDDYPSDDTGSPLLIAEAETGSGKTEAALARFFRLFAAGRVDGLYFALPTRVAARELYGRVVRYVEGIFAGSAERPGVLLAVPGYARVDNVAVDRILPGQDLRWDDDRKREGPDSVWAAEHPKRFLAATIAVGTVDQALLSSIQVRHAHLRSVCLDRSLLVVDEVHASDPYMQQLLEGLLRHHLGLGGHALLLSATLGSRARARLTGTSGPDLDEACAAPYPALTGLDGRTVPVETGSESTPHTTSRKRVQVEVLPWLLAPEQILPHIESALRAGARVLVVLNTVGRAIGLQKAIEAKVGIDSPVLFRCEGVVSPHHGRYAPVDREVLDRAVTARMGKGTPPGPVLLIGTQTLEQSLDIDADLLITDLCPMDVLLQRIGRLHRHARPRPPDYTEARCLVLAPEDQSLDTLLDARGSVLGEWKRQGLGSVYGDLRIIQLTRDLLVSQARLDLPADNRRLVEMATHAQRLSTLTGERWQRHGEQVEGAGLAQEIRAHYAAIGELYAQPFGEFVFKPPTEESVRTRLGLDTLRILLDRPVTSPFGQVLTEITIPGHMAPRSSSAPPEATAEVMTDDAAGVRLRYAGQPYRYTRHGLEKDDEPPH